MTVSMAEPTTSSAPDFIRQSCEPERLFVDFAAVTASEKHHCEPEYESVELAPPR